MLSDGALIEGSSRGTFNDFTIVIARPSPKQPQRHYPYDENVNESGKLIDDEPVEIEHAVPEDEREPVEPRPNEPRPEPPE